MNSPESVESQHSLIATEQTAQATPIWFGSSERRLFGWMHEPAVAAVGAVLLCPPLGYESWTSYQAYRSLAELLSQQGFCVLRFDYDGTGDSAGYEFDAARLVAWRSSVRAAIDELTTQFSAKDIALIGLRFGATLAIQHAAEFTGIRTLVLWDPVVSGRRYVRELKMLATEEETDADETLEIAGCIFTKETVESIAQVDLMQLSVPAVDWQVLLLDREDRQANAKLADHLRMAGAIVEHRSISGTAAMMDVSTEDAQIPQAVLASIGAWLTSGVASATRRNAPQQKPRASQMSMNWAGVSVNEELVRVGQQQLFGVLGRPQNQQPSKLVIFLSSGTEHRVGPGRAWVLLAREMNALGVATLRMDFDGVGDSPIRGQPRRVRPYDPEFFADLADCVAYARDARGYQHVIVLGLCSGAWMAVQAGVQLDVNAVVAINPQLYWQQGDPVESLLQDTRLRRAPVREREHRGARVGLWTLLDMLGVRPAAGRWLDSLVKKRIPTLLAFAQGDDGLQYLQTRCERRLRKVLTSNVVSAVEIAGIDHPMHRHRHRPAMFAAVTSFVVKC